MKRTEEQLRAIFEKQAVQLGFNVVLGSNGYSSIRTEHLWLGFQLGASISEEPPAGQSQDSKRSKDGG